MIRKKDPKVYVLLWSIVLFFGIVGFLSVSFYGASYVAEASNNHQESGSTFTDVTPDMLFYHYIEAINAEGITTGYPDGTYRPGENVTRGEMAAFLARGLGLEDPGVTETSFSDVSPGMLFYHSIEAINAEEITTGYPDGTYRPGENVTRGEMAAFLARGLGLEDPGVTETSFSDVLTDMLFYHYIEAINAEEITTGYPDGTYRPGENVTRGEMAAFLARGLGLLVSPHFDVFPETDICGIDWKPNTDIKISIEGEDYYRKSDETGHFQLQFDEEIQVEVGDQVTVFDGVTEMTHTVKYLVITDVNLDTNEVFGEAEANAQLEVGVHDATSVEIQADTQGQWSTDLSAIHEIAPGDMVFVFDRDELGNATGYEWHVPDPGFGVFPKDDYVEGLDWPGNADIEITIDGQEFIVKTNQDGFFVRRLFTEIDIQPGAQITVADVNDQVEKTHVVKDLLITDVDYDADIVEGKAEKGSTVRVFVVCDSTWDLLSVRIIENIEEKKWQADFSTKVGDTPWEKALNIKPDEHNIRAVIRDQDRDATVVDWYDQPYFGVNPEQNIIDGWYWSPDSDVGITINDGEYSATETTNIYGNFMHSLVNFDVKGGDEVTVSDGSTTRTYEVIPLTITEVNIDADTLTGTTEPNHMVIVRKFDYQHEIWDEADGEGNWTVNYYEDGPEGMNVLGPDCFGDVRVFSDDWYYRTWLVWPQDLSEE